jgi:hypothetical protein
MLSAALTVACTSQSLERDPGHLALADSLRGSLFSPSRGPVVGDTSPLQTTDSARLARELAWAEIDTSTTWFERMRRLDLTADGRADRLVILAKGKRGDSLVIRLFAVVESDTFQLAGWYSNYELVDPPFPRSAPLGVIDSYVRDKLNRTLTNAIVQPELLSAGYFDGNGSSCGEAIDHCLARALEVDSTRYPNHRESLLRDTLSVLTYNYGYESGEMAIWFPPVRRFLRVYGCC